LRTSLLVTLSSQLIFSILLHIHISKASNPLLSICVNVHVSAAYSATHQTKQFIIFFFSSSFILPVNNFFFSQTLSSLSQFCSEYLFGNIQPLIFHKKINKIEIKPYKNKLKLNYNYYRTFNAASVTEKWGESWQ